MEHGMRLKVQGPMVVHANRPRNIHDNGLDRVCNRNTETGLSSTQVIESTQWANDYNATKSLSSNENYKLSALQEAEYRFLRGPSPVNSIADDEDGQQSSGTSSSDASPEVEDYRSFSHSSDTDSEDRLPPANRRGIVNPNYPGFQHFASQLHSSDSEDDTTSLNNINNNNNDEDSSESLNQLDSGGGFQKTLYDKPKFDISVDSELCNFNEAGLETVTKLVTELNIPLEVPEKLCVDDNSECADPTMVDTSALVKNVLKENNNKMADAFLSGVKEEIQKREDTNRAVDEVEKAVSEIDESVVPRKKEKMEINLNVKKVRTQPANVAAHQPPANMGSRSLGSGRRASARDKKKNSPEFLGGFDVYNIETAMPTIDLDAIENHLKAAREEERRRRNDREEIRRRLATGCDTDEYYGGDRPGRKPSLQARLQSGMNLQICFMNDTMSDTESPSSDSEPPAKAISPMKQPSPLAALPETKSAPPANGNIKSPRGGMNMPVNEPPTEADFFACQARLQAEARLALAQAKDLARLQMEVERQRRQVSPITEMLRTTLHKVGVVFPHDRRRVSRQMLTDMNVAQLQVIVNDLHTQIEYLNESLVKFLMERDDLHMSQDSMLVDIEDLTRYLGAKENTFKEDISFNNNLPVTKPKSNRIAGLVRK